MPVCHVCRGENLTEFLDLGHQPHSDSFLTAQETQLPEMYYPLAAFLCSDCGLVQIGFMVDGETLYQKNYIYETSITAMATTHYHEMARAAAQRFGLSAQSLVVDIGSNVGTLLSGFKDVGVKVLGVDPAPNIARIANSRGIETIPDFFTETLARKIVAEKGRVAAVMATNIFAHLFDLHDAMKAIAILLDEHGVFITESPYLVDLYDNLEYDTIYHQHLRYLSIKPMQALFAQYGMEIFDVEHYPIHGGSFRVFVARKGTQAISPSVQEFLDREEGKKLYDIETWNRFALNVQDQRRELMTLLYELKQQGKRIVCVSAPAKGNTLLNYCHIDRTLVEYMTEKSQLKQGLYTPGMNLPIRSDQDFLEDNADYAIILAWNFADEIMKNLAAFKEKGGKFIIPIPKPKVV